jgi:hypothetical protein
MLVRCGVVIRDMFVKSIRVDRMLSTVRILGTGCRYIMLLWFSVSGKGAGIEVLSGLSQGVSARDPVAWDLT